MSVYEQALWHLPLINDIAQILLSEDFSFLLLHLSELVLDIILLISDLFEPVITRFLCSTDLSSQHFERFIHLEADGVPSEVLDVVLHRYRLVLPLPSSTHLNLKLSWLLQLLGNIEVHSLIPLATGIELQVVL